MYCIVCNAEDLPPELYEERRAGPNHYSVRFGDVRHHVYMSGFPVENAFECMVGDPGWVVIYDVDDDGLRRYCECGSGEWGIIAAWGDTTVEKYRRRA